MTYHAIQHYLHRKYSNNTEIYLFTNQHHTERYNGSAIQHLTYSVLKTSYRVSTIMFGGFGWRFEALCSKSQGCCLSNIGSFKGKSSRNKEEPMFYLAKFIEYVNHTRDLLTEDIQ